MKKLIVFLVLICAIQLQAQSEVINITTYDKMIQADIGEYPVTIYLKYHQNSEYHENVYSVKGWYYYNNYRKPIHLVGYYAMGDLYLYQVKNEKLRQKILDLDFPWSDLGMWKIANDAQNGYTEYFEMDWLKEKMLWENRNKKLTISTVEDAFEIRQTQSFLKVQQNQGEPIYINVEKFGIYPHGIEFLVEKHTSSESNILLTYAYPSNPNPNGRCGGGQEKGFYHLVFDKNIVLKSLDEYVIESCSANIYTEKTNQESPDYIEYELDNDGKEEVIMVDKATAQIGKIEPF